MKNILHINGSPRGEASGSYMVARHFTEGYIRESGAASRTVHLGRETVAPCTGCYACWSTSPGRCVQKDAMDNGLLEAYAEADLVVLSTPIYHYGMGALLKGFFERTLPMNYPYMVKKGDLYVHPKRYEINPQRKFILFATAGFPDEDNFRPLSVHLTKLLGPSLVGEFHIPEGELYRQKELSHLTSPRLALVQAAGEAFARTGTLPENAQEATAPIVDKETFASLANESWEVPGERRPSEAERLGIEPYQVQRDGPSGILAEAEPGAGYVYLSRMAVAFNAAAAGDLVADLGFTFTDTDERVVLHIAKGKCRPETLSRDEKPEVMVKTSLETWKRIGAGDLDGQTALMQGAYRVEGDFNLFMRMNSLFGGGSAGNPEKKATPAKSKNLMALAFIPWYFGWWLGGSSIWTGQVVPLILGLSFLVWREKRAEATWFERGTVLAFAFLTAAAILDPVFFAGRWNALTTLCIALVWGTSLFYRRPLTADYSKGDYPESITRGSIFIKVNTLLTGLWALLFTAEAAIGFTPLNISQGRLALLSGLCLIPAGIFTAWFPKWYPGHLARRGSTQA